MSQHPEGLHHFHLRKRMHVLHELFPHPEKWKRYLDNSVFVVGIVIPFFTIPQLMAIWANHSAENISLVTWISYLTSASFWLVYGMVHREKPIIVSNVLWVFLDIVIVTGIILYR